MSLSGYEDDVALLGERTRGLDGRCTVFDDECRAQFLSRQAIRHVLEDIRRLFVTGVIGGQDELLAAALGDLRHHGSFAFVAVAAAADDGDQLSTFLFPLSTS